MSTPFGDRIRRLRKAKGLTQKALARKVAGSSRNAVVSDWERGVALPAPHHFFTLAEVLGVGPQYLYTGVAPAEPGDIPIVDLAFELQSRIADLARDERISPQGRRAVLEELLLVFKEPLETKKSAAKPKRRK